MNHRFAYLIAVCLALAADPCAVMSASSVRHAAGDVDILVAGAPQPRYAHDGRWYVEALKGREYAIRLRNPYAVRAAPAMSAMLLTKVVYRVIVSRPSMYGRSAVGIATEPSFC